jgi:hypothetical protein
MDVDGAAALLKIRGKEALKHPSSLNLFLFARKNNLRFHSMCGIHRRNDPFVTDSESHAIISAYQYRLSRAERDYIFA